MDTLKLFQTMIADVHQLTEGTIDGLTEDQLQWLPEGLAHPIAATYAHQVLAEDFFVQMLIQGKQPIVASTPEGKAGLSELPPPPPGWDGWARTVRMDLAAFRTYARDVFAATDELLARMSSAELDRVVEHRFVGSTTVAKLLTIMVLHHAGHTGENAAIKGLQNLQGYST